MVQCAIDDQIRSYAEGLSADELIHQVRAFIGVFEAVHGPVPVASEDSGYSPKMSRPLSDVELISEVKRALVDIGAM